MLSLHTEGVQQAFTGNLPTAPPVGHSMERAAPPSTDDELTEASAPLSAPEVGI